MSTLRSIEPLTACGIREFTADDIPQVAQLHARVWPNPTCTFDTYDEYFRRVYVDNPDNDPLLPSLVTEDERGRVVAFLGVVGRRLVLGERVYRAAISSQFIVERDNQAAFVAIRMLRAYLAGPQDVSIADESTDAARGLWTGLGGTTAHLLGMYWTRPLRPARYVASLLRARPRWALAGRAVAPGAAVADALLARVPGTPWHQPLMRDPGAGSLDETLSAATAVKRYPEFCHPSALRAEYDERTFQRLLDYTARVSVQRYPVMGVVTRGGRVRGWYIAALDDRGECDVVQLVADRASTRELVDQLFRHAWRRGALAVTGRMDPRFVQALSDTCCVFHRRGPWMLFKTANADIHRAFESGDTCFSRIDGEWALRLTVPRVRGVAS